MMYSYYKEAIATTLASTALKNVQILAHYTQPK